MTALREYDTGNERNKRNTKALAHSGPETPHQRAELRRMLEPQPLPHATISSLAQLVEDVITAFPGQLSCHPGLLQEVRRYASSSNNS